MYRLITYILLIAFSNAADKEFRIRISSTYKFAGADIEMKGIKDTKVVSIPAIREWNNRSSTRDLWMHHQHIARIVGPDNFFINLSFVQAFPEALGPQCAPDDFKKYFKENTKPVAWDTENLAQWLTFYTQSTFSISPAHKKLKLKYPYFELKDEDSNDRSYFIKLSEEKTILFHMRSNMGFGPKVSSKIYTILKSIKLKKLKKSPRASDRAQVRHLVNKSPAYLKSREKVLNHIKDLENWWHVETDNYIIKTNVNHKNTRLIKEIQKDIETIRLAYEIFIPPKNEIEAVSVLVIPATREEYFQYVPEAPRWSGGVWIPVRDELIISPSGGNSKKKLNKRVINVVFHEAFHQYLNYALGKIWTPTWYNEGQAELLERTEIKNSGALKIVEHAYHTKTVLGFAEGGFRDIKIFIFEGDSAFYGSPDTSYPKAWGLVYFLRKACSAIPEFQKKGYDKILPKMTIALKEGINRLKATQAGFESIDMSEFQKDLTKFWTSKSMRKKAERYKLFDKKEIRAAISLRKRLMNNRNAKPSAVVKKVVKKVAVQKVEKKQVVVEKVTVQKVEKEEKILPLNLATLDTSRIAVPIELKPSVQKIIDILKKEKKTKLLSRIYAKRVNGNYICFIEESKTFAKKSMKKKVQFAVFIHKNWSKILNSAKIISNKFQAHALLLNFESKVTYGVTWQNKNLELIMEIDPIKRVEKELKKVEKEAVEKEEVTVIKEPIVNGLKRTDIDSSKQKTPADVKVALMSLVVDIRSKGQAKLLRGVYAKNKNGHIICFIVKSPTFDKKKINDRFLIATALHKSWQNILLEKKLIKSTKQAHLLFVDSAHKISFGYAWIDNKRTLLKE
ncbi:MAG: hypothetical protein MJH11_09870 [Lentisphaeria bacterium]|nr:hypothetical protein [Lentisphaeria bacterium]